MGVTYIYLLLFTNLDVCFHASMADQLLNCFSRVRLCENPQTAAHQAPRLQDSPGKNTGVSCHFLFQCMKVKCESETAQSCLTRSDPRDCSLPGSPVHGIFQARVLGWVAIAFSTMADLSGDQKRPSGRQNLTYLLSDPLFIRLIKL